MPTDRLTVSQKRTPPIKRGLFTPRRRMRVPRRRLSGQRYGTGLSDTRTCKIPRIYVRLQESGKTYGNTPNNSLARKFPLLVRLDVATKPTTRLESFRWTLR